MSRKIIIALLVLLAGAAGASAKKKAVPKADIKVTYNYHKETITDDGIVSTRDYPYTLLSSQTQSKFYNTHNEFMDSLESTPSGRKISHQIWNDAVQKYTETGDKSLIPYRRDDMYIFKSTTDSSVTVYDRAGLMEMGYYVEPLAEMKWEIADSAKTVLGYECVMATTDYHGRHWTAWFTPDIPLQEGPWKLCGLPGLILEASEADGQHSFTAVGIEKCDMPMYPIYNKKNYDKMTRIDMLKGYRAFRDNSAAISQAVIRSAPSWGMSDFSVTPAPKNDNKRKFDFLETDYH